MSGLFENLGAGSLLKSVQITRQLLENLNISSSEPEVARVVELVSDLIDIVQSFEKLATKERRHPSIHLNFRSQNASSLLHLRAILDSTSAIIDECRPFVRLLQPSLEALNHQRNVTGYVETQNRLENQAWYVETYQALSLFTELLRTLFTAINLLQYQDDIDEDTQSLKARSATATQLHYEITLVEQRLHISDQHDTGSVRISWVQ
jgi:hypothetical protein